MEETTTRLIWPTNKWWCYGNCQQKHVFGFKCTRSRTSVDSKKTVPENTKPCQCSTAKT